MVTWGKTLITLLVGGCFGWLMLKKKVPAGILVGAIFGTTLLNLFFESAVMPANAKLAAQITTGAFLGCGITREDIRHLPQVAKPFFVVMCCLLITNLAMGLLIWQLTPLDLMTSLLCSMPGGVSDTPLIAMDMGADVAKVAVLQFVRMIFGVGALPGLIVMIDRADAQKSEDGVRPERTDVASRPVSADSGHSGAVLSLLLTISVAALGGFFGRWLGIAAGALTFSMLLSIAFKLTIYPKAHCPLWLRRVAQLLSGCCIGSSITRGDVFELRYLVLPALLLMAGYLLNCILAGRLVHRLFGLSTREGMLSAAPAGASEMAFIAADMGVYSPNLIVLQICRLISVMAIFPQIFMLLLRFF